MLPLIVEELSMIGRNALAALSSSDHKLFQRGSHQKTSSSDEGDDGMLIYEISEPVSVMLSSAKSSAVTGRCSGAKRSVNSNRPQSARRRKK